MKESYFYRQLDKNRVQCRTCGNFCLLESGATGLCGVRRNIEGILCSLTYGRAAVLNLDPIEKKPLFHFLPGSQTLSLGTVGCPFKCKNCQNWQISQDPKTGRPIEGRGLSPSEVVTTARQYQTPSISYTYTDVTAFLEYALDTMKEAQHYGIKNCFVSQGYMTVDSIDGTVPYLDAINIDLKSFSEEFYRQNCDGRLQPVLDTARRMKERGVWVEITTLCIPTLSNSEEMFTDIADFIYRELGPETPWHLSRFSGAISWQLKHLPDTPAETLEKGYEIGKKRGLRYVYIGNAPELDRENTYCPRCGALNIKREVFTTERFDQKGCCLECSEDLDIITKT